MDHSLLHWIEQARAGGWTDEKIRGVLRSQRWHESEIEEALEMHDIHQAVLKTSSPRPRGVWIAFGVAAFVVLSVGISGYLLFSEWKGIPNDATYILPNSNFAITNNYLNLNTVTNTGNSNAITNSNASATTKQFVFPVSDRKLTIIITLPKSFATSKVPDGPVSINADQGSSFMLMNFSPDAACLGAGTTSSADCIVGTIELLDSYEYASRISIFDSLPKNAVDIKVKDYSKSKETHGSSIREVIKYAARESTVETDPYTSVYQISMLNIEKEYVEYEKNPTLPYPLILSVYAGGPESQKDDIEAMVRSVVNSLTITKQ